MTLTLRWKGKIWGVPRGSLTRGQVSTFKGVVPADVNDAPYGIVMDDALTDSPLALVDIYGEGSIIEDSALTLDENSLIFSDGDGTYSTTIPAGAAGTKVLYVPSD